MKTKMDALCEELNGVPTDSDRANSFHRELNDLELTLELHQRKGQIFYDMKKASKFEAQRVFRRVTVHGLCHPTCYSPWSCRPTYYRSELPDVGHFYVPYGCPAIGAVSPGVVPDAYEMPWLLAFLTENFRNKSIESGSNCESDIALGDELMPFKDSDTTENLLSSLTPNTQSEELTITEKDLQNLECSFGCEDLDNEMLTLENKNPAVFNAFSNGLYVMRRTDKYSIGEDYPQTC
ncbi:hypothetical protein PoB_004051600 [Plakobranchus ocellatus]|uniref:Uncharacterized protein n=1 Tax=Plakobranchus ocellatus TaxID=259542 RepID=A0AAV4B5C0_9GAST|nr:hypothetical protein PoB_004051600 [Plakobranchus ocellatus]